MHRSEVGLYFWLPAFFCHVSQLRNNTASNGDAVPAVAGLPPRRALLRLPSIRRRFARMCAFCRWICWKGVDRARAAPNWPPNTSPRNSRSTDLSLRRQRQLLPEGSAHRGAHDRGQNEVCLRAGERRSRSNLTYGSQIVSKDETGQPTADFDAPIVFVGYGIHAPEYNWDDYAGVDLKGKIALVIVNEPPSDDEKFFKGKTMTYYGRWTYKYEEASRRGALGVLIIHRTDLASYGWQVVREFAGHREELPGRRPAAIRCAQLRGSSTMWRSSCSRSRGSAISTRQSSARASAVFTRRN